MVNPTRNRKFTLTSEEMVGIPITEVILEKVSPRWVIGDFSDSDRDSGGRLSGSLKKARRSAIADMALEKTHGRRYG